MNKNAFLRQLLLQVLRRDAWAGTCLAIQCFNVQLAAGTSRCEADRAVATAKQMAGGKQKTLHFDALCTH